MRKETADMIHVANERYQEEGSSGILFVNQH